MSHVQQDSSATTLASRGVERLVAGRATSDGAGVKLTRVLTQDLQRRLDPVHRPGGHLQDREADALLLGIQGMFLEVQHARRREGQAVPQELLSAPENGALLAEQSLELPVSGAIGTLVALGVNKNLARR